MGVGVLSLVIANGTGRRTDEPIFPRWIGMEAKATRRPLTATCRIGRDEDRLQWRLPRVNSAVKSGGSPPHDQEDEVRLAPKPERLQAQCDKWNRDHKIGTAVRFFPVIGGREFRERKTRTEAYVLGGHTAVLFLEDESGCVALSAVEAA